MRNDPPLRAEPVTLDPGAANYTAELLARLRAENHELRAILEETRHELRRLRARTAIQGAA